MLFVLHLNGEQDNIQESMGRAQAAAHDALHAVAPAEEETTQERPQADAPDNEEEAVEDDAEEDDEDDTRAPPHANLDVLNVDESMELDAQEDMEEDSGRKNSRQATAEAADGQSSTKAVRTFRPSQLISHIPDAAAATPVSTPSASTQQHRISPQGSEAASRSTFQEALLELAPGGAPAAPMHAPTVKHGKVRDMDPWDHVSHAFAGDHRNGRMHHTVVPDTGSPSQPGNAVFHPSGLIVSMLSKPSKSSKTSTSAPTNKKSRATAEKKMSEMFHKKLAAYKRKHHHHYVTKAAKAKTVRVVPVKMPSPLHEMARHTRELVPVAAARAKKAAHSAALNAAAKAILEKKKQAAALKAATAAAVKAAVVSETASVHRVGHAFSEALKTKESTRVHTLVSKMKHLELRVKAQVARRSGQERSHKDHAYRTATQAKLEKRVKVAHARSVKMQRIAKRKVEVAAKRDLVVAANRKRAHIALLKRRGVTEGRAQFRKLKAHVSQKVKSFTHKQTKMQKTAAAKKKWADMKQKASASEANVAEIHAVIQRTKNSVPVETHDADEEHEEHDGHNDEDDEQLEQLQGLRSANQVLQEKLQHLQLQAETRKEVVAKRRMRQAKHAKLQRQVALENAKHERLQAKIAAVSKTLLSANTPLKRQNQQASAQLVTA